MYDDLKFLRGGVKTAADGYIHVTREGVHSLELIMVTEGTLYMFVGDERYTLSRGDVLRILPDTRHGGYRESDVSFIWLHMTGVGEAELPSPILSPSGFERAAFLAREAIHYGSSDRLPKECADYLMRVLLAELTAVRDETDGVVYAVKRLVGDGGGKLSSAKEVARALGYSEDYLSRILRKACGVGLKQYIDGVRIDAIKRELLTEDMRLSEVALSFGFSEYKAFLKFFKYHEGITPTEFIRSYHG